MDAQQLAWGLVLANRVFFVALELRLGDSCRVAQTV